jgi:4-alpha-glucanotransferase
MRRSGVLLHPTSLPGPHGIGDSPYQCFSAFAGNPLLISVDHLLRDGLLPADALHGAPHFPERKVDYGPVITHKFALLARSFAHFKQAGSATQRAAFEAFKTEQAAWLDDYALFRAIKDAHGGNVWNTWPRDIAEHAPKAVKAWRSKLADAVEMHQYVQWLFFTQWGYVKQYANRKGIQIVGDLPIFIAFDSADAWASREQFFFDKDLQPTVIAGVPPDYFSPTGQRWGNPLYRWDVMQKNGFVWWIDRLRSALSMYDIVRIDHFRGFEAYWEVPASEPTAMKGSWVKAPGYALFKALRAAFKGEMAIIAEDLGVITPEVEALRDQFKLPGMRVLQFAFVADTTSAFLPHNYIPNCVAYSGTHDNDTTVGWFKALDDATRAQVEAYVGHRCTAKSIAWDMARLLMISSADTVVLTMQDLLGLGTEARMNYPGRAEANWAWRCQRADLDPDLAAQLRAMTATYGRLTS